MQPSAHFHENNGHYLYFDGKNQQIIFTKCDTSYLVKDIEDEEAQKKIMLFARELMARSMSLIKDALTGVQ